LEIGFASETQLAEVVETLEAAALAFATLSALAGD
jgi:hypothetical protein